MSALRFTLDVRRSAQRRIAVTLEVDRQSLGGARTDGIQEFFLPAWTPGSYLIREYARHLGPVRAEDAGSGQPLPCCKSSKNRFAVTWPPQVATVRLVYDVYAHELTVRTSDLTAEHAYWNHACVLLWPVGGADLEAEIRVQLPDSWDLACSLPADRASPQEVVMRAEDHDRAVDSPCLAGRFTRLDFHVRGVPHAIALDGLGPVAPPEHLVADVSRIIEQAADVFGGELPYRDYLFLSLFSDRGGGGLEHRESSTLLSARTAMSDPKTYQDYLGLVAHEHFHVWNVKRMRPEELWRYDYERENYTPMLWLAEGWTAYYDDLLCRRADVVGVDDYLKLLARNLTNLWSGMGRFRQSLGEASFDAWIRLYRPDENTRNATQNYYGNGALAALVLDLTIRRATAGARSLDDALARLYRETYGRGRGYRRSDVEQALTAAADQDLAPLLRELVDGPLDPDFGPLLADFGVELVRDDTERPHLGLAFEARRTVVSSVTDDGPAHAAGIAPGDELLALDGLRTTSSQWSSVLQAVARVGQPLRALVSSRGVVTERVLVPSQAPVGSVSLRLLDDLPATTAALRQGWLGTAASRGPGQGD